MSNQQPEMAVTFAQALDDFLRARCHLLSEQERNVIESAMADAFRLGVSWSTELALKLLADALLVQRKMTTETLRVAVLSASASIGEIKKAALDVESTTTH